MGETRASPDGKAPTAIEGQGPVRRAWASLQRFAIVRSTKGFANRHRRFWPAGFFVGGIVWDALTLERIDAIFDNTLLISYIVVLGALIVAALLAGYGVSLGRRLDPHRDRLHFAIQFLMGALFSAHVIFYSQSASLTQSSIFLVVLVALLVVNEFVHDRSSNPWVLVPLYYLAVSAFLTFFIPVLTKSMSYAAFVAAGLLAAAVVTGMLVFVRGRADKAPGIWFTGPLLTVAGLFVVLNVFYVNNWIPPVPLSMRDGGAYHRVEVRGDAYLLSYEQPPSLQFWKRSDDPFHWAPGDSVYCFSSVFAPTQFSENVYHEWRRREHASGKWATTDRIGFKLVGGRAGGYRGYTFKKNVGPGEWQVNVKTDDDRTIGQIRFDIVQVDSSVTNFATRTYR